MTRSPPSSPIAMTKAGSEIQRLMLIANRSTRTCTLVLYMYVYTCPVHVRVHLSCTCTCTLVLYMYMYILCLQQAKWCTNNIELLYHRSGNFHVKNISREKFVLLNFHGFVRSVKNF